MAMTSSQLMSSLFKVAAKTEGLVRTHTKEGGDEHFSHQSSDGLIEMAHSWYVKAISCIFHAA